MQPNKAVQSDNLRAVRLVVSLSLNFTTRQTAHKLRLTAALEWKTVRVDTITYIVTDEVVKLFGTSKLSG